MKENIVILGGGVAGLASAYRLLKKGYNPIIIEKEDYLGGLATSYKLDNFNIDKYYHHIFINDKVLLNLINELGLNNKLIWKKTRMGIYYKNKIYNFSTPIDLLLFKPLKFFDRIKFGINILKTKKSAYGNLDSMSAEKWLVDNWGFEVYQKIFKPLLRTKFGFSMDKASAAFVFGRVKARASSRSKSMIKEELGYVLGSFQIVIDKLEDKLREQDCKIITKAEVTKLKKNNKKFELRVKINNKINKIKADYVINTLPIPIFSKILENFEKNFMDKIKKIKYQGVICAVIGLRKKLSDLYWININSNKVPFGGVVEHTNFISPKYYNGQHIMYVFNYIGQEYKYWKMSDKEIIEDYFKGLSIMFNNFKKEDVLWYKISRTKYATPLFTVGYGEKIKDLKKAYKGVYFAGSPLIYPESRNVNSMIRSGYEAAKEMVKGINEYIK